MDLGVHGTPETTMDSDRRLRNDGGFERTRSFSFEGNQWKHFVDSSIKLEWNASSMGVCRNGRLAVVAARRGFLVVNFDNPTKPKKIICNNKWEPGALEWNPHQSSEDLFASVVNQKIEIWNINELSNESPRIVLSGHTRTISDINWNYYEPSSLLTCSMDTYINLWDIRQSRKPASTFTTVAGSSQVRWNHKNKNLFASAHDGDVRIWDIRKGNIPSVYIAGHLSKIHGFDWSPQKESYFVTASNDSTVKFWDMNSPKQPRASINNGAPVWKARYTPFGNGLVTVLVPQLRRSENSLFLWNTSEFKTPIHKFDGHTDVILEFQWRLQQIGDQNEYQLVSLSKDQTLRLWRADKKTVQAITGEYEKLFSHIPTTVASPLSPTPSLEGGTSVDTTTMNNSMTKDNTFTTSPVLSSTMKEMRLELRMNQTNTTESSGQPLLMTQPLTLLDTKPQGPVSPPTVVSPDRTLSPLSGRKTAFRKHGGQTQPVVDSTTGDVIHSQTLQQEFSLISLHNHPVYKIEKMDWEYRLCTVSAKVGTHPIRLQITFPLSYPDKVAPNFQFGKDSKLDVESRKKIIQALSEVAQQHVKFNRTCLEPCLRQLIAQIQEFKIKDSVRSDDSLTPQTPPANAINSFTFKRAELGSDPSYQDSTVPFPRTCGARFCGVGDRLVVFSRPEKFNTIVNVEKSVRSLSALYAYFVNLSSEEPFDNSTFEEHGTYKTPKSVGPVYVCNTSGLLPVSKYLAQNYYLNGEDPSELCLKNASLAQSVHRNDLVQTWSLLAKVMDTKLNPNPNLDLAFSPPWSCHPFGKKLVESLFKYYESVQDIQTLAMISCMLAKQYLPDELKLQRPAEGENKIIKSLRHPSLDDFQVSPEFPYNVYNKMSSGDGSWSPPTFVEQKLIDPEEELRKQHSLNCYLIRQTLSDLTSLSGFMAKCFIDGVLLVSVLR
ncbi:GATOR complex protein WDR59-like isoform X2 [Hydractinia symbiolongicarpus]|uniref:GATOR complex protein WDR59-like isoform X2 n=1 Tax=Hydractinia symbiolongicarpus TaxID=13093 RepID=UPI00255136A1|nr:GATOR complex protein WDR59-like isoform X2 [Hydractinia symbiolongicarpus]